MRILSKYKDYYDYLSGIYGEDPKLILDRRDFDNNTYRFLDNKIDYITLFICGYRIEGVYKNGNFYYGNNLLEISKGIKENKKSKYWLVWSNKYYEALYYIFPDGRFEDYILGEIVEDKDKINEKYDCPILLQSSIGRRSDQINVEKWPILGDLGLASYIQPEKIYQWLVDWLSQRETDKEQQRDINLTDNQKIENKGFSNKRSFRPKMK